MRRSIALAVGLALGGAAFAAPADDRCDAARPADEHRACLEAHQTLMDINPENVTRFKDVTKFLAEDLEKLRGKSKG